MICHFYRNKHSPEPEANFNVKQKTGNRFSVTIKRNLAT